MKTNLGGRLASLVGAKPKEPEAYQLLPLPEQCGNTEVLFSAHVSCLSHRLSVSLPVIGIAEMARADPRMGEGRTFHRGPTAQRPVKEYSALLCIFLKSILFVVYACIPGGQGTTGESQFSVSTM